MPRMLVASSAAEFFQPAGPVSDTSVAASSTIWSISTPESRAPDQEAARRPSRSRTSVQRKVWRSSSVRIRSTRANMPLTDRDQPAGSVASCSRTRASTRAPQLFSNCFSRWGARCFTAILSSLSLEWSPRRVAPVQGRLGR